MNVRCIPLCIGMALMTIGASSSDVEGQRQVTTKEIDAVVLAITDEIYSHHYNPSYAEIGGQLRVYVDPTVKNELIWVIYKLLPLGELYRSARILPDGIASLAGSPDTGFPIQNGTVFFTYFLDDDELMIMKNTWKRREVAIHIEVTREFKGEVMKREEMRRQARGAERRLPQTN